MKWVAKVFLFCFMVPLWILALPVIFVLMILRGLVMGVLMFYDVLSGVPKSEMKLKWKIR